MMKSLSKHIVESFEFSDAINEAFKSSVIEKIFSGNKKLFQQVIRNASIGWSEITDNDIEEITGMKTARALSKSADQRTLFIWLKGDKLLGASRSNWVNTTEYYWTGRGRGRSKPHFASVSAISKEADKVLIIKFAEGAINTDELRNSRWASQQDVAAWQSSSAAKNANMERYRAIKTERKKDALALTKDEALKAVDTVMDYYSETIDRLRGTADWNGISRISERIKKLMDLYKDYLYHAGQNLKTDWDKTYHLGNLIKISKEIENLLKEVEALNAEMEE